MKIGLHYHVPFCFDFEIDGLLMPGYFGVFVKGLLDQVEQLIVFGYLALPNEVESCDYCIKSDKLIFINLGKHNSAPYRVLRGYHFLRKVSLYIESLDSILIRTPTPMIIPISFLKSKKIQPLIVGEYDEIINAQNGIKGFLLKIFYKWMRNSEVNLIKRNLSFTNSAKILGDYYSLAQNMNLIKTTTVNIEDAYPRLDTCQTPEINLLYVGRLDPNKNLIGLLKTLAQLNNFQKKKYKLNLVYLSDAFGLQYKKQLELIAEELNISKEVVFHGQKTVGVELNKMYRQSDIFLLASLTEGFPRVIWESMINHCPVIATKVGSIPHYLEDKKNAILIDPGNNTQIMDAILLLVNERDLRRSIISNAFELVKNNTIEIQTKDLLTLVYKNIHN